MSALERIGRLAKEKEILGFYTSGHPLDHSERRPSSLRLTKSRTLSGWNADPMTLAVVVTNIKRQLSSAPAEFARLTIEDFRDRLK